MWMVDVMYLRRKNRSDAGFTLVETLASLMVFAIVTLGVVPLLAASLQGSSLARSSNVAKNLAVKAMERARGLPYYVAYSSQPVVGAGRRDVDLLDLYHPLPPGADGTANATFTTTCTPTSATAACPTDIPENYRVIFDVRFVQPDGSTLAVTPGTYDSNTTSDEPPSLLADVSVTVAWDSEVGRDRTFTLRSLIGDRNFGRLVQASAEIIHGVQVDTRFDGGTAVAVPVTRLLAVGGSALSEIEQRSTSVADQSVSAAEVTLTEDSTAEGAPLDAAIGAFEVLHAPGDTTKPDVLKGGDVVTATGVGDVAGIDQTVAGQPPLNGDLEVSVDSDLPSAKGGFSFESGSSTTDFWVDNPQARGSARAVALRLLPTAKLLSVEFQDNATDADANPGSLLGFTNVETEDPFQGGAEATAQVQFETLRLFPTDFVLARNSTYGGAVVVVDDFVAEASCEAFSRAGLGAGEAKIEWSATVKYWSHAANNYVNVPVSGDETTDPLAALGTGATATNPVVFRDASDPTGAKDVRLFESTTGLGYLKSWASVNDAATETEVADGGRTASAQLTGALTINTTNVPGSFREFPFNISIGTLGCETVDFR